MPTEGLVKAATKFAEKGIRLHIDDGCLGGGEEDIEYPNTKSFNPVDTYNEHFDVSSRSNVFIYCILTNSLIGPVGNTLTEKINDRAFAMSLNGLSMSESNDRHQFEKRLLINIVLRSTLSTADEDGDGLQNWAESIINTDPLVSDSDGDGMNDGYEFICSGDDAWYDPLIYNNRYALLFSSGEDSFLFNNLYRTYITLIDDYGYLPENIFVLFYNGTFPKYVWDSESGHTQSEKGFYIPDHTQPGTQLYYKGKPIIDGSCDETNLKNTINEFNDNNGFHDIQSDDMLFIFGENHGNSIRPNPTYQIGDHSDTESYTVIVNNRHSSSYERLFDWKLEDMLHNINCYRMIVAVESCYSGGFIYNLGKDNNNRIVMTGCRADQSSAHYSAFICALHGSYINGYDDPSRGDSHSLDYQLADIDGNGYISIREAFNHWTNAAIDYNFLNPIRPQLDDDGDGFSNQDNDMDEKENNLAAVTYL